MDIAIIFCGLLFLVSLVPAIWDEIGIRWPKLSLSAIFVFLISGLTLLVLVEKKFDKRRFIFHPPSAELRQ